MRYRKGRCVIPMVSAKQSPFCISGYVVSRISLISHSLIGEVLPHPAAEPPLERGIINRADLLNYFLRLGNRELRKANASFAPLVLAVDQFENPQDLTVIAPQFANAESGVDRRLLYGTLADLDLDGQIGRRIRGKVDLDLVSNLRLVLN